MWNSLRRWNSMQEHLIWANERLEFRELFNRVDRTLKTVDALLMETAKPRTALKRRGARVEHLPKKMAKMSQQQEQAAPINAVAKEEPMWLDCDAADTDLLTVD